MNEFLGKIATNIINPAIILLFVIALVAFLWGVLQFVRKAGDEEARTVGGRHIMYGIIGMAIMISAFGIMRFITGTIGAENTAIDRIEGR